MKNISVLKIFLSLFWYHLDLIEIPRKLPLLREGAVPCFLPGCLKYLSVPESSHPCNRLKFESKETESFDQMINESRETFKLEEEKFNVANFIELERKLNLVTSINWLLWSSDGSIHFILPHLENSMIRVEATLTINSNLTTHLFIPILMIFILNIQNIHSLNTKHALKMSGYFTNMNSTLSRKLLIT